MRLFAQAFWLPKSGSTEGEYEDAFWPRRLPVGREAELSEFRVAVADGATETSFSWLWAKLLVRSYAEGQLLHEGFGSSLARLQHRWQSAIAPRRLPWYAEEKVKSGAAAAFVGLHLADDGAKTYGGHWDGLAVGDCCLVQMRTARVIERFPITRAGDFSNRPKLLLTKQMALKDSEDLVRNAAGCWLPEDSFYLMSDALAAWFMRDEEGGGAPWETLRDLGTGDGPVFSDWIEELRCNRQLRNDDVTLVRVDIVA